MITNKTIVMKMAEVIYNKKPKTCEPYAFVADASKTYNSLHGNTVYKGNSLPSTPFAWDKEVVFFGDIAGTFNMQTAGDNVYLYDDQIAKFNFLSAVVVGYTGLAYIPFQVFNQFFTELYMIQASNTSNLNFTGWKITF